MAKKAKAKSAKKAKAKSAKKAKAKPAKRAKTRPARKAPTRARPAWPMVRGWIDAATHTVEVLPASSPARQEALEVAQVPVSSALGAVIHETGGLFVDHGWLRVLGSGHPRLPRSVPAWTRTCGRFGPGARPGFVLVADDVLGGFFALDGGALGPGNGDVYYFGPDTLVWEPMELMYPEFLRWSLQGDLEAFYGRLRWHGWQRAASKLDGMHGIHIHPPLWTAGPSIARRMRGHATIPGLWKEHVEILGPELHGHG